MPRSSSFWRHAVVIGALHVAVLIALVKWSAHPEKSLTTSVLWMNPEALVPSAVASVSAEPVPAAAEPTPAPPVLEEDQSTDHATPTPATSEIPAPISTPLPSATPTPRAKPTSTPHPTPKPRAEKKHPNSDKPAAKPTPKQREKKTAHASAKPKPTAKAVVTGKPAPAGGSKTGGRGGAVSAKQFAAYGNMLHDRFFSAWVQPKSVVVTGATMSALVRLRIERDGRVSQFTLVRPSGNVVVDESVAAVAKRVPRVDPLPAGLADDAYEVQINFELNPQ